MNNSIKKGFTLIEIMLVVIIIGIIGAMVFPRLTGQAREARVTQARTQIEGFRAALQMYEMHNDRFPTTEQGLEALFREPTTNPPPNWRGPYMESIPDDPWGNPYQYRSPGDEGRDYEIISFGPDGVEGTDDDIKSWRDN